MCSSLYQRLNSASCSGSTSVHSIRSPVPRVLAMEPSGDVVTIPQLRCPLCQLGRVLGPPAPPQGADAPEVEAQEAERLPLTRVHDPALGVVQSCGGGI